MIENVEDLIRTVQTHLAERPVHPERVRAKLPVLRDRRVRRRRYSALGTLAVAAGVVLVMAVPVVVLDHRPAGPDIGGSPSPITEIDLRYRPTLLPDGMQQNSITVNLSGSMAVPEHPKMISRSWTGPAETDAPPALSLSILAATEAAYPASGYPNAGQGEPVDINGHAGRYIADSGSAVVAWRVDPGTVLTLDSRLGLPQAELLAIARSTKPDPAQVRLPVRFGWLPPGVAPTVADLSANSTTAWTVNVPAQDAGVALTPAINGGASAINTYIVATLSTKSNDLYAPTGGTATTFRGHPARFVTSEDTSDRRVTIVKRWLVVDLGRSQTLTVFSSAPKSGKFSDADLLKVAEHLSVDADPDLTWIGTR